MVEVYDLEDRPLSELLLFAANPRGLEDRLVSEGTTVEEGLSEEELDLYYNLIREKLVNLQGQRRLILNVIDEVALGGNKPVKREEFSNEEQLSDYITANIWGRVHLQVRGMESRHLEEQGGQVRNVFEDSVLLRRIVRYRDPNKMPAWKKAARSIPISVAAEEYRNGSETLPLLRQVAEKTPHSTARKWGEKLAETILKKEPVQEAVEEVRDYVKGMIVTTYGSRDSGPFANPNACQSTPDLQQRMLEAIVQDPRISMVDFKDTYRDETVKINHWRLYLRASQMMVESDKEHKIIRYPHAYSDDDVMSLIIIDARNYFSYFFGEEGHLRAKMKGHRYSVHKDRFELGKKGERLCKQFEERVLRVYREATTLVLPHTR